MFIRKTRSRNLHGKKRKDQELPLKKGPRLTFSSTTKKERRKIKEG